MYNEFSGQCPICEKDVTFTRANNSYRSLSCSGCDSRPRNRALFVALTRAYPKWPSLFIHESSPGWDSVSRRLKTECVNYVASQYDPGKKLGSLITDTKLPCKEFFVQDLEKQTFCDEAFDVVVAQDVFEHLMDPIGAIREIERTLKPGGAAILSVPVVRGFSDSRRRAAMSDGKLQHLLPPEYHGNPVAKDSLVTIDWGYDIVAILSSSTQLCFVMQTFANIDLGIQDECNQILLGFKKHPVQI